MAKRCKHDHAVVHILQHNTVDVYCPDCQLGWYGFPGTWISSAGKKHQIPRWVQQAIDRHNSHPLPTKSEEEIAAGKIRLKGMFNIPVDEKKEKP